MPPALSRCGAALALLCACNNDADPQNSSFGGAMTEPMGSVSAPMTDGESGEPGSSSGGAGESTETSDGSTSTSSEGSGEDSTSTSGSTGLDCVPGYQGCTCLPDNKCGNGLECDPETVECVPLGALCGDAIKWGKRALKEKALPGKDLYLLLGKAYYKTGNCKEAHGYYLKVIQGPDSNNPEAMKGLEMCK